MVGEIFKISFDGYCCFTNAAPASAASNIEDEDGLIVVVDVPWEGCPKDQAFNSFLNKATAIRNLKTSVNKGSNINFSII